MTATTPFLKDAEKFGPLASRYVEVEGLPWKPTPCPGIEMKVLLEDPETGETVVFDTSGPEGRAFALETRRTAEARAALFRRLDMDPVAVSTDRPYLPALTAFFEARARRMRH